MGKQLREPLGVKGIHRPSRQAAHLGDIDPHKSNTLRLEGRPEVGEKRFRTTRGHDRDLRVLEPGSQLAKARRGAREGAHLLARWKEAARDYAVLANLRATAARVHDQHRETSAMRARPAVATRTAVGLR
ncbi:MAG: hypothetical protein EB084_05525 [Proteobacteria bacterium]|nr:hypothetical protein [Pseudomonadota bacterium]